MKFIWRGKGINEKAYEIKKNKKKLMIVIDKRYFRPTEVDLLIGDPTKAHTTLGWIPEYNLEEMINEMMEHWENILKS